MEETLLSRQNAMLKRLGVEIAHDARILEFGCGAGRTVYSLLDAGYANTIGFEIKDYLDLRKPADRSHFVICDPSQRKLPFKNDSFDVVVSDQVLEHVKDQIGVLREIHRVMRPGGHAVHIFPARYCVIEPHIYVPFGGVFAHRWWYQLWALIGIRNESQTNYSAARVADLNSFYFAEALNYVPNSIYEVVWTQLGYEWKWLDQQGFDTSSSRIVRIFGIINRVLPLIGWANRTFRTRKVYLQKPVGAHLSPPANIDQPRRLNICEG